LTRFGKYFVEGWKNTMKFSSGMKSRWALKSKLLTSAIAVAIVAASVGNVDGGEESVDSASEVCGKSVTGRPQAGAGWVR